MAEKVIFDPTNKLIICKPGIFEIDIKVDLYSDAKEEWKTNSELNRYKFPFRVIGGDETVPPEVAPLYLYLCYGWRLRPDEASHTLKLVNGTLLVDEDPAIDPVVSTEGDYNVMVRDVVPIRATQIQVEGDGNPDGGGDVWTPTEQAQIRDALGIDGVRVAAMEGQLQDVKLETNKIEGVRVETDRIQDVIDEVDRETDSIQEVVDEIHSSSVTKIRIITYTNTTQATQARVDRHGNYFEIEPGQTVRYEIDIKTPIYE